MQFNRTGFSDELLLDLYKGLLKPRLIEEKMLLLIRQGEVSKWFSGIGQEAISVGAVCALAKDEYILPMHRNLGIFTGRNIPLHRLFSQFQGKMSGFTKGRDRSFHFGSKEHHIVGMISHLGAQLPVADGIALAQKQSNAHKATLVISGDGGTSEGDFHEALNVAAVWQLPVIFLIENNGYGLSTPNAEQFRFNSFSEKGAAYGMDCKVIDGNNVLEVYSTIQEVAEDIRQNPKPVLIEALTFRMRGHEEASGTKYIPQELFEEWGKKDPLENFERFLVGEQLLDYKSISQYREEIEKEIEEAWEKTRQDTYPNADEQNELYDVYAPNVPAVIKPATGLKSNKRYIDAIQDGMRQAMIRFPKLVLMGQDIAEYGGVFKATEGFVETFGKERVRNTPLCESAILGISMGMSILEYKTMVEMQFADFVTCGFNQIVNNLAKSHYRWGQAADVVIRMPTGAGTGGGPYHSQSNEAWFFHTPGLKIVYPSTPYDAKGLLLSALEEPNPVLYFEHKSLYRSLKEDIPDDYYTIPLGKAHLVSEGSDLSIITYGMCVHWAAEITQDMGISADLLDLRTLLPWDKEAVRATVAKTGKVLIVHEDTLTGGIGAEIAAWISEHCFDLLDAPVFREGALDTAVPFAGALENNFLPKERMKQKIFALSNY
ncbi:MAG: dehydrogenase E1 component subunit alpha/beta [Cytophagaceae bacterium]|nr:dehydrogenase E1 component subunit alpha/beta [Cytophagaceae bacterium]